MLSNNKQIQVHPIDNERMILDKALEVKGHKRIFAFNLNDNPGRKYQVAKLSIKFNQFT